MDEPTIPEGFCAVDNHEMVFVNKEGVVYNGVSKRFSNAHSFSTVTLHSYQINGVARSFHLARAVAMNFVAIPKELTGIAIDKLVVKYKDNNKRNVQASNLYWSKRPKSVSLKVILECGNPIVYNSIEDAWKVHGSASYSSFLIAVRKGFLKSKKLRFEKVSA